ncbi:MAG: hypothetical protein ABIC04_02260 [Nanoarchaeota archaeon]
MPTGKKCPKTGEECRCAGEKECDCVPAGVQILDLKKKCIICGTEGCECSVKMVGVQWEIT